MCLTMNSRPPWLNDDDPSPWRNTAFLCFALAVVCVVLVVVREIEHRKEVKRAIDSVSHTQQVQGG